MNTEQLRELRDIIQNRIDRHLHDFESDKDRCRDSFPRASEARAIRAMIESKLNEQGERNKMRDDMQKYFNIEPATPANDAEELEPTNHSGIPRDLSVLLRKEGINHAFKLSNKWRLGKLMEAYASQKVREERERVIDLENEVTRLQFAVAEAQNKLINHLTKEQ